MCNGEFLLKHPEETEEYLEWLTKTSLEWELSPKYSMPRTLVTSVGVCHLSEIDRLKAKNAALQQENDALQFMWEISHTDVCAVMAMKKLIPHGVRYNLRWQNHANFSWSGNHFEGHPISPLHHIYSSNRPAIHHSHIINNLHFHPMSSINLSQGLNVNAYISSPSQAPKRTCKAYFCNWCKQ